MNRWLLAAFPSVAAAVAFALAARIAVVASRRRSLALWTWSLALAQFGLGSLALGAGIAFGWTPALFRTYYLFGAVSNVVWLGAGTIWLLAPRTAALVSNSVLACLLLVAVLTVSTAGLPSSAPDALRSRVPPASLVVPPEVRFFGRWLPILGSLIVLGGLLYSLLRRRQRGLGLLALGVLVAALASEFGRLGAVVVFATGLAAGVVLMHAGFVWTTRPVRTPSEVAAIAAGHPGEPEQ